MDKQFTGLNFGSLFAGVGGFDLGFEQAGMHCAWQVEIDARCNEVLAYHWPDVKRYGDVRDVGRHNLESVDLISGGFPCQDLSVAGRRAGLAGERSGLWWEFRRIIEEIRPRWVVIENVPGLLSSNDGRDMGAIVGALAELGYGYAWAVLDAQWFGVPQRRRRVFIVGCLGSRTRAAKVLFEEEHNLVSAITAQQVATTFTTKYSQRWNDEETVVEDSNGLRWLTPLETERCFGFPDGWTAVNRIKDTPRYKMLGNAVFVPGVEWIGRRIVEAGGT